MSDREVVIEAIKNQAVVWGAVTLASGRQADYYVDVRRITLDGRIAPSIGRLILELTRDWTYQAVGGLTLGADPVATAMMHAAAAEGRHLNAFVVRKQAKSHGMQRQIEGPDIAGKPVLVVEDTSTTGGSAIQAIEAVRAVGAIPVGVAVVMDRSTGAKEQIEALGVPYRYAIGLSDVGL